MAILSIPKSSLNLKSQSILRLGTLGMPVILLLVAGNRAKQCR